MHYFANRQMPIWNVKNINKLKKNEMASVMDAVAVKKFY